MNYIKRKDFLKKCAETFGCCGVTITAIVGIADQCSTAEAVAVVRCKDCKHYGGVTYGFVCRKYSGAETKVCTEKDHYCSYGERRENDNT